MKSKNKCDKQEEENLYNFKRFAKVEGFTETVSDSGHFKQGTPIFYKQTTPTMFLVFTIPFMGIQKKFYADFWKINAISANNFLKKRVDDIDMKDIRMGFNLQNIELYYNQLSNLNTDS